MVTKNLKAVHEAEILQVANIEKDITAKLQFEYLRGSEKRGFLEKNKTKQGNELNFHIPEKWNYEMEI